MTLLLASLSLPFATLADEPARTAQPLVVEFDYNGLRQQIVVREGAPFQVTTQANGNHLEVSGRIGRVHDRQVELELSLRSPEWRSTEEPHSREMHFENLPLGRFQFPGGAGSVIGGGHYMSYLWVRRGVDPVPELLASIRRRDANSIIAANHILGLRGDAGGLVPELVHMAQGNEDALRQASALTDVEWQRLRVACATALGHAGQGAQEAVRGLQQLLERDEDDELRIAAAVSLWRIAKHGDAPAFLVSRLGASDRRVRLGALVAIAGIGADAPSAGPSIVPLLNDADNQTRAAAAWALWSTARDPRAVDTLIAALKGGTSGDTYAIETLGRIGYPAAGRAAPLLVLEIFYPRPLPGGRTHLTAALKRVDPAARLAPPLIIQEAVRRNEREWAGITPVDVASEVLASYGSTLLPTLSDLLQDENKHARLLAFYTLWRIGAPATGTLANALRHEDPQIRRAAAGWLKDLQADAAPAVPDLVQALNDDVEAVRTEAFHALQDIGAPAVMAVRHALQHGNERTRQLAEQILQHIQEVAEMDNGA